MVHLLVCRRSNSQDFFNPEQTLIVVLTLQPQLRNISSPVYTHGSITCIYVKNFKNRKKMKKAMSIMIEIIYAMPN